MAVRVDHDVDVVEAAAMSELRTQKPPRPRRAVDVLDPAANVPHIHAEQPSYFLNGQEVRL